MTAPVHIKNDLEAIFPQTKQLRKTKLNRRSDKLHRSASSLTIYSNNLTETQK